MRICPSSVSVDVSRRRVSLVEFVVTPAVVVRRCVFFNLLFKSSNRLDVKKYVRRYFVVSCCSAIQVVFASAPWFLFGVS